MALKRATDTLPGACAGSGVGGRGGPVTKRAAQAGVKRPLVQILVVVANIQMGTLKTEVEQGSRGTAVGPG